MIFSKRAHLVNHTLLLLLRRRPFAVKTWERGNIAHYVLNLMEEEVATGVKYTTGATSTVKMCE